MTVDLCRHIKTNGLQCHGAALAGSVFCYFHNRLHRTHDLYRDKVHFQSAQMKHPLFLQLPAMEDRESVQLAISCVINALATGCIDRKEAMALFYGLQLASTNARGLRIVRRPTQIVRDIYKEGWTSVPEANVDIAPPGRTMEIEEPVELDESNDVLAPLTEFPGKAVILSEERDPRISPAAPQPPTDNQQPETVLTLAAVNAAG